MDMRKIYIGIFILCIAAVCSISILKWKTKKEEKIYTNEMNATVLEIKKDEVTVQDENQLIYTFHVQDLSANIGDQLLLTYTGILDKNKSLQEGSIVHYKTVASTVNDSGIPTEWVDEGLFKNYFSFAYQKLQKLSLDEKIGQLFLVRYSDAKALSDIPKYHFGGFVFYESDFANKTSDAVRQMINSLQSASSIPLLTAVDEEGGRIIRVSSNPNLVERPFLSSQELYAEGGFSTIATDTQEKSKVLKRLGLNLNLAPVVDVSTHSTDYIYERSFGQNTELTSTYAKTVIEASKETGISYTLKHFPGYGNNTDTHIASSIDNRTYAEILNNDFPPFESGIRAGAEAVLVSHNTVTSIDNNPASLSPSIHNILRNHLDFTGVIITDDLSMGATATIDDVAKKAILSGNDLLITTDYEEDISAVRRAVQNGTISEDLIDRVALRVLAWKYYKGLIIDHEK